MEIFNHKYIKSEKFYEITSKEEIKKTPANSIILFDFDFELANYAKEQGLRYAMRVKDIKEVIYANALGASYILADKGLSMKAQEIADDYMFDSKILLFDASEDDIEFCAIYSIDGVVLR